MLDFSLPFAYSDPNVIVRYGVRRIRWAESPDHLGRYSLRVVGAISLVALALWLLMVALLYQTLGCSPGLGCSVNVITTSTSLIGLLLVVSIAADLLLDFACFLAVFHTLNLESHMTHWELLTLSSLSHSRLIHGHYVLAKIRAWRIMAVVIGLRAATVLLILAHVLVMPMLFGSNDFFSVLVVGMLIALLAVFFFIFLVEPYWRMQAVTALAIALALRFRQMSTLWFSSGMVVVLLWIVQMVVLVSVCVLTWAVFSFAMICFPVIGSVAIGGTMAGFYGTLHRRSLDWALCYNSIHS